MKRHELSIEITLISPFLFPAEQAGPSGFDMVALRASNGRPIIPQDQIRGVLRHALMDVAVASNVLGVSDVQRLFGLASSNARNEKEDVETDNFEPNRGVIYFSDLHAEAEATPSKATRICIDPETGAVETGSLFSVELVANLGCEVSFTGVVHLLATDADANKWISALQAASTWVSAMGAMKTAGFGEVVRFEVTKTTSSPIVSPRTVDISSGKVAYEIVIDRPFLVDAQRAANNVFIGTEIIPGGVIKGALARKLQLAGMLDACGAALTQLGISHARVSDAQPVLPLSLYVTKSGGEASVHDALVAEFGAGSIRFQSDWKAEDACLVAKEFDLPDTSDLSRDVRTHVEINRETGTALDHNLYVSSAVVAGEMKWRIEVDYSNVEDDVKRHDLQRVFEAGLWGVGQTGATLDFSRSELQSSPEIRHFSDVEDEYAIVLQSDAVMCERTSGKAFDSYAAYWRSILPKAKLLQLFASQCLAGGYIARRFQTGSHYAPFVLTQAGSVFLLKGDVEDGLNSLVKNGLPTPVINGEATTWQNCPFQPENGYGKVSCYQRGVLK